MSHFCPLCDLNSFFYAHYRQGKREIQLWPISPSLPASPALSPASSPPSPPSPPWKEKEKVQQKFLHNDWVHCTKRNPFFSVNEVLLLTLNGADPLSKTVHSKVIVYLFICPTIIEGVQSPLCVEPFCTATWWLRSSLDRSTILRNILLMFDFQMIDSSFLNPIRALAEKLIGKQTDILRFIAMNEILLMPCLIFMAFT